MRLHCLFLLALFSALAGCSARDDTTYTLYRETATGDRGRVHVATFDAEYEAPGYNRDNCAQAAKLYLAQPGVSVRFWCEKGRFRK